MIIKPKNPDELVAFLKSRPIVLYGTGDTGLRISKWCDKQHVEYMFADKNASELNKTSHTHVLSPQDIIDRYPDANIVVSSIVYSREITKDLLGLGIEKERIFSYTLFMSDNVSWGELEDNRLANWSLMHKRYKLISEWGWINDDVKTVADYGAGYKFIKQYLPLSARYYPVDCIDRGDDTIICDFNKKQYPDLNTELSVCTGVLMYIKPAIELIDHICEHTGDRFIFSYVTLEGFSDVDARRRSGIGNDFTERQIIDMISAHKFTLTDVKRETDGNSTMTLFLFRKSNLRNGGLN